MCIFLCQTELSVCDILSEALLCLALLCDSTLSREAKYAEKIQAAPTHGPSILSSFLRCAHADMCQGYVWFGLNLGCLGGSERCFRSAEVSARSL